MKINQVTRGGTLRRIAYATGTAFALASLAYVVWIFLTNVGSFRRSELIHVQALPLAAAACLYTCALIGTAAAWPVLVRGSGPAPSWAKLMLVGLASQGGKYLPGNVAHYFGRAALARTYSIDWKRSAGTTIAEVSTAVIAALLVALPSIVWRSQGWVILSDRSTFFAAVAILAAAIVAVFGLRSRSVGKAVVVLAFYLAAFVLAGYSFFLVGVAVSNDAPSDPLTAIAIFALAWIAGFIVPGAPAGLGIREVVLLTLLTPNTGVEVGVLITGIHRLVTMGVDVAASLIASLAIWQWKIKDERALG
jgi:hypothetical protein